MSLSLCAAYRAHSARQLSATAWPVAQLMPNSASELALAQQVRRVALLLSRRNATGVQARVE
eukprot:scaffold2377_cov376-Prasinococcus_capsulatus_cf.AAC.12